MKTLIFKDGVWAEGAPAHMEKVRILLPGGGHLETFHNEYTKAQQERDWRDSQLSETDSVSGITDHPKHQEILSYRSELRDYPNSDNFPDGERPLNPLD